MTSPCGFRLLECRCAGPVTRTPDQIAALHQQAQARAVLSGWAAQPVPVWVLTEVLGLHVPQIARAA